MKHLPFTYETSFYNNHWNSRHYFRDVVWDVNYDHRETAIYNYINHFVAPSLFWLADVLANGHFGLGHFVLGHFGQVFFF